MAPIDRYSHVTARCMLVVLFPFSALDKVIHWPLALAQANSSFIPHGGVLLVLGMLLEAVAPFMILLNWYAKPAALLLAVFCIATAVLHHNFWAYDGFWAPQGGPALDHFWDFLKNIGLAGGLMFVALGGRLQPVRKALQNLSSSNTRPISPGPE